MSSERKLINSIILTFVLFFLSCGEKTENEITEDIVNSANNFLSTRQCNRALDLLITHGHKSTNAKYLKSLASAYACKAGYDTSSLFTALSSITGTSETLLGSLVQSSLSTTTGPSEEGFTNLQTAIDTLLFAGDVTVPTSANRASKFTAAEATDLNVYLLYLVLAQLGKYSYLYGNANPIDGTKGNGDSANGNTNGDTNTCFLFYQNSTAQGIIDLIDTAPCNDDGDHSNNESHVLLDRSYVNHSTSVTRMCQGVVLFNNFMDLVINISVPTGSGNLGTLQTAMTATKTLVCNRVTSGTCNVYSQSTCESNYGLDTSGDSDNDGGSNALEIYFASVWEFLFTD